MGNQFSLSQMREDYLLGKIDRKQLEGDIFQYLLVNRERYNLCRECGEQWFDFLAEMYPRISRAVDAYRDTGSSFDSYIITLVHWSYKEHRIRETSHQVTEYTWWRARAEESMAASPEAEYFTESGGALTREAPEENEDGAEIPEELLTIREKLSRTQILILFMKSYYFVSEDVTAKVAKFLDMKKEGLYGIADKLHKLRAKREEEIREIENGIQCQYYRCISYEKRLRYAPPGSACAEKLKLLLERAETRFGRMRKRLSGIRFDATNSQIAEILNIPKGTVDSALHSIRKKSESYGFVWEKPLYSKKF